MKIPFELLHTFVLAARAKRMATAASTLGLTPGAVSQRIKELESVVRRQLLVRSPKGVEFTRAGQRLFERIDDPLRVLEALMQTPSGAGIRGGSSSPRRHRSPRTGWSID